MFAPRGIAISHDGSTAYVAESAKNSVSVIDLATNEIVRHISVGAGPSNVALTSDGRIVSSNSNGDTVSIVSDSDVLKLPSAGSPWSIAVSPETNRIYVTELDANKVSVIADLTLISQPESIVVSAGQNVTSAAPSITGAPSGSLLAFSANALPSGLSIDTATGVISGVAEIAQVATTYDITATYAGQQIPGTHRVTIEITPGLAPASQDIIGEAGEEITSQALSPLGFPEDNSTVFSAEGLPSWLSLDAQTGVVSGTSDVARARSEYKITATNGNITASATVAITVTSDAAPVLSLSASTVKQGEELTVTISDAPVGAIFDISLHSDPVTLGTMTIDENARASADFTIPAAAATGVHTIVATYGDYTLTQEITVVGSQTAPEEGNTTTTTSPDENLAETGINLPVIAAIAVAACALLAVGAILVNRSRKQS